MASNIKDVTREKWNADDADIHDQLWHIILVSEFPFVGQSHSLLFYRYVYNVKYQCFKKKMKKSRNFPSGQRGGGSRGVNSCNASVVLRNN